MNWIGEIIKKVYITEIFILIFITMGIVLFNPFDLINILKMETFVQKYQTFFGVAFIISTSFLILVILKKFSNFLYKILIFPSSIRASIRNLSPEEKQFLIEYFYSEKTSSFLKSSYTPWSNGYTTSLLNKNIIYWSGGSSALIEMRGFEQCVPFTLTSCAYKYINKKGINF